MSWQTLDPADLEREYSPSPKTGGQYRTFIEQYATSWNSAPVRSAGSTGTRGSTASTRARIVVAGSSADAHLLIMLQRPISDTSRTIPMKLLHVDPSISGDQSASRLLTAAEYTLFRGARMLEDFLAADVIFVGARMYNFSLSKQLKAWLDRLVLAGKTFCFTATGAEGLAKGKRVIVASSRGFSCSRCPATRGLTAHSLSH